MSHEAALLETIRDNPENDMPRLAYAGWLARQGGDAARAEFIAGQCTLARTDEDDEGRAKLEERVEELLTSHRPRWAGTLNPQCRVKPEFTRGFVERVVVRASVFLDRADELFAAAPVLHEV